MNHTLSMKPRVALIHAKRLAVFLLAVTHAAAFLYGAQRDEAPIASNAIDDTEQILRQMAELDATAPHDRLQRNLISLRGDLAKRDVLARLSSTEIPAQQRPRAERLASHVGRLMIAFEQVEDPGFRAVAVRKLASQALGVDVGITLIPSTAQSFERITPLGAGRFRIFVVRGEKFLADEGTVEELETRHVGLEIHITGEER